MAETWLSQEAHDRLRAELEELTTVRRVEASKAIELARAHGDIRENAEYDAAKEEQAMIEARIRQVAELLRVARVGEAPPADVVAPGLVVTLEIGGEAETYLMVGSREDRREGYEVLSTVSPLGRAVLGTRVGDVVTAEAPAGSYEVRVIGLHAPDA